MEITINNKTVTATESQDLEVFTKPELMDRAKELGICPVGKVGKTELTELVFDHYEENGGTPAPQTATTSNTDFANAISALQANAEALRNTGVVKEETPAPTTETSAPDTTPEVPSPVNAPDGMVYCRVCKKHVPKATALSTSTAGEFMCKKLCKPTTTAQAAAASTAAKNTATRAPKANKPAKVNTSGKFAPTDIITCIGPRQTKGFSAVAFGLLREGLTVKEACELIAAAETGAITGRSELNYDVNNGWIKIVSPDQYAADNKASETDPEATQN